MIIRDGTFIERLWRSLKYECVYLHAWVRISRRLGGDFARCWARVSRHSGQPFHGIVGRLADVFMESGLSDLVKRFCDAGAPAEAIT